MNAKTWLDNRFGWLETLFFFKEDWMDRKELGLGFGEFSTGEGGGW